MRRLALVLLLLLSPVALAGPGATHMENAAPIWQNDGPERESLPPDGSYTTRPQEGHAMSEQRTESPSAPQPLPTGPKFQNLIGRKYHRLTVVAYHSPRGDKHRWLCQCDCGGQAVVTSCNLKDGHTKSCGCTAFPGMAPGESKHGRSGTPEHRIWKKLIERCENPNAKDYSRWGGRGIKVCGRWRESFPAFLADMGPRPSNRHSIDRIDNDGNYEPGNCRWATRSEQGRNKRSNRRLTFNGETHCLAEWAQRVGLSRTVLDGRIRKGWSVERALTTPMRIGKKCEKPSAH